LLARKEAYGANLTARGPQVKDVTTAGKNLVVTFDQPVNSTGGPIRGFAIAGDDGDYRFADAVGEGRRVTLTSTGIAAPKTVRFAWGGLPDANLINGEGLPAGPFRTDTLAPHSLAFQPLPAIYRLSGPGYQIQTNELGHVSSLIAGGKQFLSAEPDGGTSIPGGFGPRALPIVAMTGPNRIECRDREVCLEIACEDEAMEWTLTNDGGGEVSFQIALAEKVVVAGNVPVVELARSNAKLRVEGIERVEAGKLIAKVNGKGAGKLKWTVVAK
jgi:hypothetical protein